MLGQRRGNRVIDNADIAVKDALVGKVFVSDKTESSNFIYLLSLVNTVV